MICAEYFDYNLCYSLLHLVKSSTESCEKIDERKKQLENAVFEAHQWTLNNIPESIQPTDKLMKYVTETEDKQAKLFITLGQ